MIIINLIIISSLVHHFWNHSSIYHITLHLLFSVIINIVVIVIDVNPDQIVTLKLSRRPRRSVNRQVSDSFSLLQPIVLIIHLFHPHHFACIHLFNPLCQYS